MFYVDKLRLILLLIAAAMLGAGCDTDIDFQGERTEYFALHGYLDTRADTQFVRATPITSTPESLNTKSLNMQVHSEHLETGTTVTWTDSLVRLDDGSIGHLFYTEMAPQPGERYRLTVTRPDDPTTTATIRTPPARSLEGHSIRIVARIITKNVVLRRLQDVPHRLRVCYRVARTAESVPIIVEISYQQSGERVAGGRQFTLHLSDDRHTVLDELDRPSTDSTLVLYDAGLVVTQLSDNWNATERGRNIRNGRGFFGAVSQYGVRIPLSDSTVRTVGYAPPSQDTTRSSCADELVERMSSSPPDAARRALQPGISPPE